jgi:hypothetical protein
MIPFQTTAEQILKLDDITIKMRNAGINDSFINNAKNIAITDQGVFDLMELWTKETDLSELAEIINDIQKAINDYK